MIVSFQAAIQRRWRLFGTSRLARLIAKTARPAQCDTCWDYHSRYACDRKQACRRCGGKDHRDNDCKQPERRTIRVLQANVAKIGAYHSIALRLAEAENYDVVLIQEPNVWIEKEGGACRTQTHRSFHAFAPERAWEPDQAPSDLQDVPERCLIAGDFNACHFSWQPGARSEATHARGNTIDLALPISLCGRAYRRAPSYRLGPLHDQHYAPGGFPKDDS
ncbi:endonuclease/Exonuclease/phosphatase family protein [Hirsutella rhossiliensis]